MVFTRFLKHFDSIKLLVLQVIFSCVKMADHLPDFISDSENDDEIIPTDNPEIGSGDSILSEKVAMVLFGCAINAINFMIWTGIAILPVVCAHGCAWKISFPTSYRGDPERRKGRVNSCFLACPPKRVRSTDAEGNTKTTTTPCPSKKSSWRTHHLSFQSRISSSIGPQKLARLIFRFAQKTDIKTLKVNTGIGKHSLSNAVLWIRHAIMTFMLKLQSGEILGGGSENPEIVVLIDETHMTRKQKNKGGFRGKKSVGHTTVIVGMYELDISQEPRVGTGRAYCWKCPINPGRCWKR